ncbi:C40 family peptidase [Lactobacillus amylovorus]|jgi:cell wall-associated NlpC family hydrolase|uniref:C40 family peptidase n=1 Tax=Lactobacillus amylovorus TaxID=1604 RepID=UPI001F2B6E8D|nr:C40 family peptidase [Lactobacillus amylovorus]MCI7161168.1 C40 family peptidase [Lactobacillus amylovorus]MCT3595409.1 NlpC/P60 family protein [Lactobacillus amylovorus]MDB6228677.1 C40 family peptidase [Lactobacillus amylovorus]MDB6232385.1 C40 family peptidase [Lactobacillus amylovorus]MDY2786337.1 C40 family peptidase [Lactobacillus amylovorus]
MSKHKLFKLGAAAALSVTGVSAITSLKTVRAANFTAVKRVKISYLPGKSLNIWTNYENGKFMGYRAKDGSVWNVAETAVDSKGSLWYKVGTREWIEARYTVDVSEEEPVKTATKTTKKKSPVANLANKVKRATQKKKTTKEDKVKKANQIVNETVKKTTANKKTNTSSIQASSKAASVVALAKEQVGKPYVWGATGPDKFDCSGLVQYVYQHAAGINLPRTTYDQVKVGQTVPLDKLQAGDLVFWGSETAPYHVAIYIGNNQYVNSATPDQGTILQNMSSYYYPTIAKRVL